MIDYDLVVGVSRKLHSALGTTSQFDSKSSDLSLVSLMKESDLKIKNTEGYFNLLDQKKTSDLKFASFDKDKDRRKNFLIHAFYMLEEAIEITIDDKSFNKNLFWVLICNYIRVSLMLTDFIQEYEKKNVLIELNHMIDSITTDILFLKSWVMFMQAKILLELKYIKDSKSTLELAQKLYFENYSDFYFTLQEDYGKNYWDEYSLKLQNDLSKS
jgi:hypothetical protein